MPSLTRRRAAFALLLLVLFAWMFVARASTRMPDFEVYWRAGARAAAAEPLYRAADTDYQFKYFPAFAVLTIPLGTVPIGTARAIWFSLSAAAFVALLALSTELPERRRSRAFLITMLLIGLAKYYAEELILGQINILVALVAACAILAFQTGRDIAGGLLVALAIVLKPYALILAPWVVARRRWHSIAAMSAGLGIAVALPAIVYGLDGTIALHRDWWRTVTTTTEGTLLATKNVSLTALWARRVGIGPEAMWLSAASSMALLIAAAAMFIRRNGVRRPDGLEAGVLLAMTPLISPQGWDYVLVLATPMLVFLVNDVDRLSRPLRLLAYAGIAAVGLTLFDLLGRRVLYALLEWSVVTLGMLALIAAAVAVRMRKLA